MEQIDILIQRIGERLSDLEFTERGASLAATRTPDALRYIRTRRAMPSAARLASIARVLSATPEYLLGQTDYNNYIDIDEVDDFAHALTPEGFAEIAAKSQRRPTLPTASRSDEGAIPVYFANRGADQKFQYIWGDDNSQRCDVLVQALRIDQSKVLKWLANTPIPVDECENVFSIFMPISCLNPAIPAGDLILASTVQPIRELDLALFYVGTHSDGETELLVIPGQVRKVAPGYYEVGQFQAGEFGMDTSFRLDAKNVVKVERIYTLTDFLS